MEQRTSASSVFLTRSGFGIRRGVTFGGKHENDHYHIHHDNDVRVFGLPMGAIYRKNWTRYRIFSRCTISASKRINKDIAKHPDT